MNLPNKLTVFRIFMIPLFVILTEIATRTDSGMLVVLGSETSWWMIMACIVFVVASVTDWLDGYIARQDHLVTDFGKFADPLADKMLVITAMISLTANGIVPAWAVSVIVMRELAVTGLRLLLAGGGNVMAAAWPGKVKTVTQMLAIILLLINDFPFAFLTFPIGQVMFYISVVMTVISMADYFWKNRAALTDF
ncbi:MAG: CDP-diacylglycerol--glycerol-3-phosphate 3-phosphatidyltransferase [Aerococcus sp.]|nr:CDP-diacylglycerol--glycerol-3-phosphate 3-phosphatidyltransferase [Aerococcus sp.]